MLLFINDRPIRFITDNSFVENNRKKHVVLHPSQRKFKLIEEWDKHVLIPHATSEIIAKFFFNIKELKKFNFKSATFIVADTHEVFQVMKSQYKFVDAAGGVILNQESKVLMINRLKKWDLPKGKAEKKETIKQTAEREVEEECGITVNVSDDYIISYHTYLHKNQRVLKRTYWFKMNLISDKNMKPQLEEDIEEIRWMNRSEMHQALKKSYRSIEYVLDTLLSQELSFSKG